MSKVLEGVAPFPMEVFRSYSEFTTYLRESEQNRGLRWLHERSMASNEKAVSVRGVCGLCLTPTTFVASTRGGESAPKGLVPNWREGLQCGCEYRLINRQRALLHYLAAEGLLRPWTRILLMGETANLLPVLTSVSDRVTDRPGPLRDGPFDSAAPRGGYHLILSAEQLTARLADAELFSKFYNMLAPGGTLAFTAPFDISSPKQVSVMEGAVGWCGFELLPKCGFPDTSACTFWSEELGYLGPFNMIVRADRR